MYLWYELYEMFKLEKKITWFSKLSDINCRFEMNIFNISSALVLRLLRFISKQCVKHALVIWLFKTGYEINIVCSMETNGSAFRKKKNNQTKKSTYIADFRTNTISFNSQAADLWLL